MEDVLRAECGGEVAVAVGDELQAKAGGEGGDEIGVEVGDAAVFSAWPRWLTNCFLFTFFILRIWIQIKRKNESVV